jgi:hypothetical protein
MNNLCGRVLEMAEKVLNNLQKGISTAAGLEMEAHILLLIRLYHAPTIRPCHITSPLMLPLDMDGGGSCMSK